MRVVVRLLVTMALVAGMAVVVPVAFAAGTDDPTESPAAPVPSTPVSPPASSPSEGGEPSAKVTESPAPLAAPSRQQRLQAAAAPAGHTKITAHPRNPTVYPNTSAHSVTLSYQIDKGIDSGVLNVQFHCTLKGSHYLGRTKDCGTNPPGASSTSGSQEYSMVRPSPKPYKFTVWATYTDPSDPTGTVTTNKVAFSWRMYSVYAPGKFMPHDGASFNNPLSSSSAGRKNLTRMIKTINAMPGYREGLHGGPCPATNSSASPGTIRVSLYSMTDTPFAKAMNKASKRCLSVQILMNDHLSRRTDPAWRRMEDALGTRTKSSGRYRRSFAHRCHRACRGGGVLHTKMFLFDSSLPATAASRNKIKKTVFVGSSNMTSNAAYVQWNDLYGDVRNPELHKTFASYFNLMRRDNGYHRNNYHGFADNGPKYRTVFWPVTKGHDPEMGALKSIKCGGATGGTGINGHTAVYINIHAWFGLRGLAFQRLVRGMYARGCYIRVLYSFMTKRVYHRLTVGTGGRMQLRRTIFANHPGGHVAGVYSHFKNFMASGNVGGDHSARVVWTGSNNFTPDGRNFDEVMIRIKGGPAYGQYRKQFDHIKHRKSSARYASFTEPRGGGRAP